MNAFLPNTLLCVCVSEFSLLLSLCVYQIMCYASKIRVCLCWSYCLLSLRDMTRALKSEKHLRKALEVICFEALETSSVTLLWTTRDAFAFRDKEEEAWEEDDRIANVSPPHLHDELSNAMTPPVTSAQTALFVKISDTRLLCCLHFIAMKPMTVFFISLFCWFFFV